jgi:hypothetical protein
MRPAVRSGLLTGFFFLLLAGRAFAPQLEGRLFLDKDHYVVGEPVYSRLRRPMIFPRCVAKPMRMIHLFIFSPMNLNNGAR